MIARRIIRADLSQDLNNLCFLANQYDDYSRKYRVIITNNGVLQPFIEQKPIRLIMKAEGESAPYYDDYLKSEEWEEGFPVVTFTASMLSKVGNVDFQFIIYEPGSPQSVSTRQQHLKIQESLIDYDGIIASEEFNFLTDLIAQATTIPALITDIHTSIDELNAKISEVNTKMSQYEQQLQTYETTFSNMQSEQQAVINALHTYMTNVENAAAASAKNSESWAIGGTGTRPGEDTNNSKYYSNLSKIEADKAKSEADRAEQYAGNVDPKTLSQINAIDVNGLLGIVGDTVLSQDLVDKITGDLVLNGNGDAYVSDLIQPKDLPLGITTNMVSSSALGLSEIIPYEWNAVINVRTGLDDTASCLQYLPTTQYLLWRYGFTYSGWDGSWRKINITEEYVSPPNNVILSTDLYRTGDFDDFFDSAVMRSVDDINLFVLIDRGDVTQQIDNSGVEISSNINGIVGKNIPCYLGLNTNLSESDKIGSASDTDLQANIQIMIDRIRDSVVKTTIYAVGSLRDIAAAYNRAPLLFKNKVDKIYVFAGVYNGPAIEWNVNLNEWAYLNIMNSGLPIYWVPCFQSGNWDSGNDASFFTSLHNELFDDTTSDIFKWFLYYWSGSTEDFNNYISQTHDSASFMAASRNLWCTSIIPLMLNGKYQAYLQQYNLEKGTNITEPFTFIEDKILFGSGGNVQHGVGHNIHRFHINNMTDYVAFSKWIIKKLINKLN